MKPNERLDEVNDKIKLIQDTDGLTFGTDALLLAGYIRGKFKDALEIGGGTGIISMLVATRGKAEHIDCVEVQSDFYELIRRNLELNALEDRITAVHSDIRELKARKEYSLIFTNPPYMRADSGRANISTKKNIARHEVAGTISELIKSAGRLLKYGGSFYAVYRPDRLIDLLLAMREGGIEPKRITAVHADAESAPSMVLVEGKRGGNPGLNYTKPLILHESAEHRGYGCDGSYIMENGLFPECFY